MLGINQGCLFLQAVTASASATSSYFSYKLYKTDPVEVTTISKECILNLKYTKINDQAWDKMTDDEKQVVATNNRKLVEICEVNRGR